MKPSMRFEKQWIDEDMVELKVEICDGASVFCNRIYVGHKHLRDTGQGVYAFKDHIYGGIFNLRFGEFGPEYASGALDARLQFQPRGKLWLRIAAQTELAHFGDKEFASEATLYLVSEIALLDKFVGDFRAMSLAQCEQAEPEAIVLN